MLILHDDGRLPREDPGWELLMGVPAPGDD